MPYYKFQVLRCIVFIRSLHENTYSLGHSFLSVKTKVLINKNQSKERQIFTITGNPKYRIKNLQNL